jgi:hypothetical protein
VPKPCRADESDTADYRQMVPVADDAGSYGGERFDLGLTIDALLCVAGKSG